MKTTKENSLFQLFKSEDESHWLVICEPGQLNAAAATAFLSERSNAPPWALWINLGISGGSDEDYGSLYLINKIINTSNKNTNYPGTLFSGLLPKRELLTVNNPNTRYRTNVLFDMEGAGFFEIASKISSREMTVLLKIVSDSPKNNFKNLDRKKISHFVCVNMEKIVLIVEQIGKVSRRESHFYDEPPGFCELSEKFHFTITQKRQLFRFLNKYNVLYGNIDILALTKNAKNSRSVLCFLYSEILKNKTDWNIQ